MSVRTPDTIEIEYNQALLAHKELFDLCRRRKRHYYELGDLTKRIRQLEKEFYASLRTHRPHD